MLRIRAAAIAAYSSLPGVAQAGAPRITENLVRTRHVVFGTPRTAPVRVPKLPHVSATTDLLSMPRAQVGSNVVELEVRFHRVDLPRPPALSEVPFDAIRWQMQIVGKYFSPDVHRRSKLLRVSDGSRRHLTMMASARKSNEDFLWETIYNLLQPPLDLKLPQHVDLPFPLYDYQRPGVEFLANTRPGALLGDDMGLGKTVQSIVALRLLMQHGTVRRALIVCPTSVLRQWEEELEQWAPLLRTVVAHGAPEVRRTFWATDAHVLLTTYGTLRQDIEQLTARAERERGFQFDVVVLDEITRIKNRQSKQAQAARAVPRDRSWGLSGTPLENREDDVIAEFEFLHPGLFGPNEVIGPEAVAQRIRPYFLRRRKDEVLDDLPELVYRHQWIELSREQQAAYDRAVDEGVVELQERGDAVTVMNVLDLIGRLKQISNVDPRTRRSSKIDWLIERLDELTSEGSKALVFSNYLESGVHEIARRLPKERTLTYVGAMSMTQRAQAVGLFRTEPMKSLLLLTYGAGAQGLNLQCANYVVLFDHWWNPAVNRQAIDRAHRSGQKRTVFAYSLWAQTEVEERIFEILQRKRRLFELVVDSQAVAGEGNTGMSEEELFGLFGLTPARGRRSAASVSAADLLAVPPHRFEQLVGDVWRAMGYEVVVTQASADAGIDVIAAKGQGPNAERIAIQCKNHSYPVGRPDAQKLVGATLASRYSKTILVATSGFTAECARFAEEHGTLNLIDGEELCAWMRQFGVELPR